MAIYNPRAYIGYVPVLFMKPESQEEGSQCGARVPGAGLERWAPHVSLAFQSKARKRV